MVMEIITGFNVMLRWRNLWRQFWRAPSISQGVYLPNPTNCIDWHILVM